MVRVSKCLPATLALVFTAMHINLYTRAFYWSEYHLHLYRNYLVSIITNLVLSHEYSH